MMPRSRSPAGRGGAVWVQHRGAPAGLHTTAGARAHTCSLLPLHMPEELAPRQWFATAPSPTCGGPLRRPVASSQEQQHCRQREQRARHKRRAPRRCPHASGLEALLIVHACYPLPAGAARGRVVGLVSVGEAPVSRELLA